ncbi:unnamed protein product [Lota lota]
MGFLRLPSVAGFLMLCASCVNAQQRGLFPAILNLASNAEVTSNATCGDPRPEMFCKLVEHVPGRRIHNPQCRVCDANSANEREHHPISKAIDGTNRWWQSPSIKNGRQFHWITITLDLHQIFQVAYVIIKAANSPRPGNWILERSLDGVTFEPWQYYAISDTECLTQYNTTPRLGSPTYRSDQEVICTSYYSRLVPLEHGEIHTSLINGRPGADYLTPELLSFTSARFIRLRLQRIRTLNADLMTLSYKDPKEVDPIVTRRYYYSIKDISVGGMCICFGHAQSCPLDPVTKKLQCVCEHNTCGESCDECCPGYHQEPWQPGTITDGNTCQKCNCHNKADTCYYNQTVSDLRLSVNAQGDHQGGGVCVGCSQNTAGVNCETCANAFYRPPQVSPYAESPCVECECDLRGATSAACAPDDTNTGITTHQYSHGDTHIDGDDDDDDDDDDDGVCVCVSPGVTAGQCVCKRGFAGRRCDRCAFGYRDFPSCSACDCQLSGSTNTDPCSPCTCKVNVMGVNCDLCKSGYYNLQASDPEGCSHCFCFGVSDVCESSSWSMSQLASYGGLLNLSLFYDVPLDNHDRSVPAHCDIIMEGNGKSLRQSSPRLLFLTPLANQSVSMAMTPQNFVDEHGLVHVTRDDLLSVLAEVTALRVNLRLNASASGPLGVGRISLDVADPNSAGRLQAVAVETCECPWGYAGSSCESCASGFYRLGGVMFGGMCLQCECNDHATECDINGVCLGCTNNTTGPQCDSCLPGYYGDPTLDTADDCQPCACPLPPPNSHCEKCADGFYGDPLVMGEVCKRCDCHGNVNVSEVGHCDAASGACLRCLHHTGGTHCDTCLPGYYGDAINAKNCQECSCDLGGAVSGVCDVTTGHCDCRPNVTGLTCDRCQVGFYGIQSGRGCSACLCSQLGSVSESCDEQGHCLCVEGMGGDKCDRCHHGYYNHTASGCTVCDCARTHGNCHPATGDCLCPPHTEGEECERCETGYWGHDPIRGCQSCDCSAKGCSDPQCDLTNGECPCHMGFSGRSCDRCSPGHHGYPECRACGCDVAGTREDLCNHTLGVCDCSHTGTCVCKASVGGRGCNECVSGTFGLMTENPDGCSPCFCSGVSSVCEERGGLLHVPVSLGASPALLPVVSQFSLQGELTGVYHQGGDMLLDMREYNTNKLAGPLYWRLPRQFEGNKTTHTHTHKHTHTHTYRPHTHRPYTHTNTHTHSQTHTHTDHTHTYRPHTHTDHTHSHTHKHTHTLTNTHTHIQTTHTQTIHTHTHKHTHAHIQITHTHTDHTHKHTHRPHTHAHTYILGYHGNPWSAEGRCEECGCSGWGALHPVCDDVTGQCDCKPGVRGQLCDQCEERHILEGQHCVSCDDDCSGVLLNDLEELHNHFLSVNLSGVSLAPFSQLVALENKTTQVVGVSLPSHLSSLDDQLHQLTSDLSALLLQATHLSDDVEELGVSTSHKLSQGATLLETITMLQADILELQQEVGDLNQTQEAELLLANHTGLLEEMASMLDSIRAVNLTQHTATHQHRCVLAESLLQTVQADFQTSRVSLEGKVQQLDSSLSGHTHTLQHTHTLLTHAAQRNNHTHTILDNIVTQYAQHKTVQSEELLAEQGGEALNSSGAVLEHSQLLNTTTQGLSMPSIRVAVEADADCVRSYRPDVRSSNFNTLSLTFKTTSPENLLFYLGSNTTSDFLAVEMHAGKVSVVWNVGSGVGRLEHPHLLVTNNKWTRINVTRFGVHGSLSVQQLESGSAPLPAATARSPGLAQILEVDNNTVIYIGGMGQQSQRPAALRVSTFQGCMGDASLNEKNIGLWNYVRREGRCRGCFTSPQSEETSFLFDGSGFSVVQKALRATSTSVVLLFKSLSPNGLLLYLASNATRDFLSMELVEGRFRLTFDLGSGALAMTSSKTYNSGVWTKITLQRTRRKGYLSIMAADQSSEKEVLEAESRGTASDLNRADLDPIYIGGLPASRPIRRQVVSRSFVGCIKNVEIARSNFDLLQDAYGVKKGCVLEAVRSVSVLKEGYVQLAAPSLGHEGELFLTFSTRNSSGLLLVAFNNTPTAQVAMATRQFLLVVQLVPGGVGVELSLGGGASQWVEVKPLSGVFSDGLEHSLIISRTRKRLTVQVDEDHVESTPLPLGESSSLPPSSVFIGGLPLGEESRLPIRLQNASRSFRGCIQNLIVNNKLVDLSDALRYDGVQLDSCLLEERTRGAVLPDDQELEPTPNPSHSAVTPPTHLKALAPQTLTCVSGEEPIFLSSTNQFGLSRNSHMTFNINPNTVRKSFVLKLSVRTHADSGLVYLLTSSNHMDYATLQLRGGRLIFTLDLGRGPASSSSAHPVNDGQWHTVRTEFAKRWVSMAIDGVTSDPVSVRGNQLDVDKTLYLGGVAHTHTWKSSNVTHSLPGCVQAVSLNGVRLETPASQHNTTSCFTHTQTGSYFNGTGYAALVPEGYKVGSDMSVSLEFRTGQSEAVLLGISSSKVDAIGLEIINRKVVFHVNNGAGRVSVESVSGVCDGLWHHLVAKKSKNSLLLSVDGHTSTTHNPFPQSTSAETNNPVYLGGYPSGVKQNGLSSRSSLRGCVKEVKLVKGHVTKVLDLSSAFSLSGVTPNSCPAAQ